MRGPWEPVAIVHGFCLFQEHTPFHDSRYPQRVGPNQHGLGGDRWRACGEGVFSVLEARSRRKLAQVASWRAVVSRGIPTQKIAHAHMPQGSPLQYM